MSQILQPKGARPGPQTANPPGTVPIRCPRCQATYAAQVVNVVDARLSPQLKAALLAGYLNRAQCPSCGAIVSLGVPLIYHDPDKELLLVLMPTELNLSAEQQQRLIGGLVQAIMSSVPAEERKGYFLRPQTMLTMQSLIEKVLEADGVTREMIDAQRNRFRLLEELLNASDDLTRLDTLIAEHSSELDYAFFVTLVTAAREAELSGDSTTVERLLGLRERLVQVPEIARRLPQPLAPETSVEEIIDRVLPMLDDPEALSAMASLNRPLFDYVFFQGLTARMEQTLRSGDTVRGEQLGRLRQRLLEEIEQQDRALQAAQAQDLQLIEDLLTAPDPSQALQQNLAHIDTLFLGTLGTAIQAARAEGNIERSARLDALRERILNLLADAMPPELKLVNRLMGTNREEERMRMLGETPDLLSENLVAVVDGMIEELRAQNRQEAVRRLEIIRAEIERVRTRVAPHTGSH